MGSLWNNVAGVLYGGVDVKLAGNGGAECRDFLTTSRKVTETLVLGGVGIAYIVWGLCRIYLPPSQRYSCRERYEGRNVMMLLMTLIFGAQVTFKLATKQVIFLLNPCHVITALQIVLLMMPPSNLVTALFRIHIYFLNGAVLALLFPVTNTLLLPFEAELYWIQHAMMLIAPFHMMRLKGAYTVERLGDFSWSIMSTGIQCLYSFVGLQAIALLTTMNLNGMLCPNISDPFHGPWYRVATFVHQSLFITACSKLYCWASVSLIARFGLSMADAECVPCPDCFQPSFRRSSCSASHRLAQQKHAQNGNATPFCVDCVSAR